MDFIATREFRIRPGSVWKRLRNSRKLVITSHGKPVAILSAVDKGNLEEQLKADAMVRGMMVVSKIREQARKNGSSRLSMSEIENEIREVRKQR